jgi:hypothetical protein
MVLCPQEPASLLEAAQFSFFEVGNALDSARWVVLGAIRIGP